MTLADRAHVPTGRAIGRSRAFVRLLVVAAAVLAGVVVGPAAHASPRQPDSSAHLTVAAHLGVAVSGVAPHRSAGAQHAQSARFGPVPGTPPDLLLTAVLLVSLLLALGRALSLPPQPAGVLQHRRGPPEFAFTD